MSDPFNTNGFGNHNGFGNLNGFGNPNGFRGLDLSVFGSNYQSPTADNFPFPLDLDNNDTAGQYVNNPNPGVGSAFGDAGIHQLPSANDRHVNFADSPPFAGPSQSSSSFQPRLSSPGADDGTPPTSPTPEELPPPCSPGGTVYVIPEHIADILPDSVGEHRELAEMLCTNPDFIPTFDFDAMMGMTGRDVVNSVSGPAPSARAAEDHELEMFRQTLPFDPSTMTVEDLASMGHQYLDMLAQHDVVAQVLGEYRYEPDVEAETISTILPRVGDTLMKNPLMLAYYQVPLKREDGDSKRDHGADEEDEEESESEDEVDNDGKKKKKKKTKKKRIEMKYLPTKVQYAPYQYRFKTAEEARMHRKKNRHPPKIARDIDRVKRYGRYYWTKRIYEAMINVDLIFDNKASTIATNFSKHHNFDESDLEATAHHVFDKCIAVHELGWNRYTYNRKSFTRGKQKDLFPESIEQRLERICGILKHNKAVANDCMQGGDLLLQTCDNPIYRASTKTANNKGNLDRSGRLVQVKTPLQLAKEAEKLAKAEERERVRAEKAEAKRLADIAKKEDQERKKQAKAAATAAEQERKRQDRAAAAAARRRR